MGSLPEVSVLLPTRNRATLLKRAVATVLGQTFRDFELIIIDDESTDETAETIRGFSDPRVRYVRHVRRRGAAAGENTGLELARAKLIAFMDDDDEWLTGKLEAQVSRFRGEPETTGVVYTGRWIVKNGERKFGPPTSILKKQGNIHVEILNKRAFIPLVCAMVRKECFDRVGGFDETLPTANDYDLWVRISKHFRMIYLPEPMVIVNFTPGSVSTTAQNVIESRKLLLQKHASDYRKQGAEVTAFFLWQMGNVLISQGEVREGRKHIIRALLKLPWKPGYYLALLSTFGSANLYRQARSYIFRLVSPIG